MIGYYVHHRGLGHLHRAFAVIAELSEPVTILSSLEPPASFSGLWMTLPLDTDIPPVDATAGGALHWAPLASRGLTMRMAAISQWIAAEHPSAIVVDVSVEVITLARLHGVPVVTYAQPGERTDDAHTLGYRLATAVIQPWPEGFHPTLVSETVAPFSAVGAISRLPLASKTERDPRRVAVFNGMGGRGASALDRLVSTAREQLPQLQWTVLQGKTSAEVARVLRESAVVFAHCGQNAVAEVAASRIPAVLVPEERPHLEQMYLAGAIGASSLPAIVADPGAAADWPLLFELVSSFDGNEWSRWCDGRAAARAAAVVRRVAGLTSRVTAGSAA